MIKKKEKSTCAPLNLQSNGVSTFNSIPLQWSPPDMPNGVILDYEVRMNLALVLLSCYFASCAAVELEQRAGIQPPFQVAIQVYNKALEVRQG